MAAIFGIIQFGQEPIAEREFSAMRQAMEVIPATHREDWCSPQAAVGACADRELNHRAGDLPLVRELNGHAVVVVADARLDNRRELGDMLGLDSPTVARMASSELILECYLKWGDRCPGYLLGDFVFAIWSGEAGRCFIARDHLGLKPLFLYNDPRRLVFATDVAGVLAHSAVSSELSDLAVAQYLGQGELYSERRTFYRQVQKLPAATSLSADAAGLSEAVYWNPTDAPPVRYSTVEEYVLRLQELFNTAVADRLPGSGPVATHLSGGLDSSAIAALAQGKLSERGQQLTAWTWMRPPRNDKERADPEWARAITMARSLGLRLEFTELDREKIQAIIDSNPLAIGDTADLYYEYDIRPRVREEGIRVVLSGWGGDQFITANGSSRYFETFWGGSPFETMRDMWREASGAARPFRRFLGLGYYRLVTPLIEALLRREYRISYLKFARPDLVELARSAGVGSVSLRSALCTRTQQLREFSDGHVRNRLESWAVAGSRAGVEYRYPLLDKRIVEFALGLPAQMYRLQGHSRYLFRAAVSGTIPHQVCWHDFKYEPARVREGDELLAEVLVGWMKDRFYRESRFIDLAVLDEWIASPSQTIESDYSRHLYEQQSALKAGLLADFEWMSK